MHADDPNTFVGNKGYHFEEELRWACWDQEPLSNSLEDDNPPTWTSDPSTGVACTTTSTSWPRWCWLLTSQHLLSTLLCEMREGERDSGERKRTGKLERDWKREREMRARRRGRRREGLLELAECRAERDRKGLVRENEGEGESFSLLLWLGHVLGLLFYFIFRWGGFPFWPSIIEGKTPFYPFFKNWFSQLYWKIQHI